MTQCEMCGREGSLSRAIVEGTELNVCQNCARFGKVLGKAGEKKKIILPAKKLIQEEIEERVIANFSGAIKKTRERKGLTQEDFAKFLNEKESVVQKWESGSLKPDVSLARKLEKILDLALIEKLETQKVSLEKSSSDEITLGDMIKVRKRR